MVLLLAGLLATPPALAQAPPFLLEWGSFGSGPGQFREPHGVAVDGVGNVYVADYSSHLVKVFSPSGVFLRSWGEKGQNTNYPGQLGWPMDVAIDAQGYVYVTELGARVQKFRSDTTFVTAWGDYGSGDGQFMDPRGIAVDALGNVYVADLGNDRVQKFASNGTFLLKWGVGNAPFGIEVESTGNVLVGVIGPPALIARFSPTGVFLGQVGPSGIGPGFVTEPAALAVDVNGNVYDAEGSKERVQVFSSAGTFLAGWGTSGSGPGQFNTAIGIAIGPGGEIYVSDRLNYRIQKFGPLPTPTLQSTWGRLKSLYR